MSVSQRLVVIRLTDGPLDGMWEVFPDAGVTLVATATGSQVLVATGSVEWGEGDRCAEVYVPENQVARWLAEHP